jgi:hypothetical protein
MNYALRYVGAFLAVIAISIALYLGAVVQIYALAFVIEGIGRIF